MCVPFVSRAQCGAHGAAVAVAADPFQGFECPLLQAALAPVLAAAEAAPEAPAAPPAAPAAPAAPPAVEPAAEEALSGDTRLSDTDDDGAAAHSSSDDAPQEVPRAPP